MHLEFPAEFGIVSTFLFDRFITNKSRLVPTIIGSYDKVYASVDANNMADIRKMTFFNVLSIGVLSCIVIREVNIHLRLLLNSVRKQYHTKHEQGRLSI